MQVRSEKLTEKETAKLILREFTLKGFQQTLMADIATILFVSRQTVYNRFGSKDQCYHWAIHTHLDYMYKTIFQLLSEKTHDPKRILINVFDTFSGKSVESISNQYGPEVLKDSLSVSHTSQQDWPLRFRIKLAHFLERHQLATPQNSIGLALAFISAAKGLLIESKSRKQFQQNMTTVIQSMVDLDRTQGEAS